MLDDPVPRIVDYLNKGVSKRSVAKISRLFTHHTLLLDPAQTHFRKIAIHALSVHSVPFATQTPIRRESAYPVPGKGSRLAAFCLSGCLSKPPYVGVSVHGAIV